MKTSRILIVAGLAAVMFAGGCMQLFAWTVAQFAPPQKVKAKAQIPKDKTILVFVESTYPLSYEPFKGLLTEQINLQLLANKVAAKVVAYDRFQDALASTDREISKTEIGRMLHADLVLCVEIPPEPEGFGVRDTDDSPLWQGHMKASLKMIDVANEKKIWPLDQLEYPLQDVKLPQATDTSPTYGRIVAKALAIKTADRIAKLFYDHTVPNTGPKDEQQ